MGAPEQVRTLRTFCVNEWLLKRALNIKGTPQTPDPSRRQVSTEKCPQASADPTDPFVNRPNFKRGPSAPQILGQQPSHSPPPPKTDMPTIMLSSLPSEPKLEATRGKAATSNEYVLSKRGEIGAEFEYLRNNLQRYAQLTPLTNVRKPK